MLTTPELIIDYYRQLNEAESMGELYETMNTFWRTITCPDLREKQKDLIDYLQDFKLDFFNYLNDNQSQNEEVPVRIKDQIERLQKEVNQLIPYFDRILIKRKLLLYSLNPIIQFPYVYKEGYEIPDEITQLVAPIMYPDQTINSQLLSIVRRTISPVRIIHYTHEMMLKAIRKEDKTND